MWMEVKVLFQFNVWFTSVHENLREAVTETTDEDNNTTNGAHRVPP